MGRKNIKLILIAIIFILLLSIIIFRFTNRQDLIAHKKIINATVYDVNHGGPKGANIIIKFKFYYKATKYYGLHETDLDYSIKSEILGKSIPIAIDTTDPKNNLLLTSEASWANFQLAFPDSIKWLKKYYP